MIWPVSFRLESFALSDIGYVRENNEDFVLAFEDLSLYLLADGMGGHKAGEIAAKEASLYIRYAFEQKFISLRNKLKLDLVQALLEKSIEESNSWVHALSKKHNKFQGMGTTLCAMLFFDEYLIHAHVGDSRIYCFRQQELSPLTKDHSLKNEMMKQKPPLSDEQAYYKNILTRALGTSSSLEIEMKVRQVMPGDIFLMCSDGLTDLIDNEQLKKSLSIHGSLKKMAGSLVRSAKEKGGNDNITVQLVKTKY